MRRNIFGLTCILKMQQLPEFIQQRLPQMMEQIAILAIKMHAERLDVIKDNKEHIANGGKLDMGDDDDDDGFEDDEPDEEEFKQTQALLQKVGPKLNSGKPLTAEEMKELEMGEDDDDSDYEPGSSNFTLDSALDEVDELKFLKEGLTAIHAQNNQAYTFIMSGLTDQEQKAKFDSIMNGVEELIAEEKTVRE